MVACMATRRLPAVAVRGVVTAPDNSLGGQTETKVLSPAEQREKEERIWYKEYYEMEEWKTRDTTPPPMGKQEYQLLGFLVGATAVCPRGALEGEKG